MALRSWPMRCKKHIELVALATKNETKISPRDAGREMNPSSSCMGTVYVLGERNKSRLMRDLCFD